MDKRKHGDHIVTRRRTVERSPGPPPLHDLSRIPLRPQSGLLLQWEHNRLNSLPGNSQPPKWPLVHSMSSRFLPLLPLHRLLDSVFIALSFPPAPHYFIIPLNFGLNVDEAFLPPGFARVFLRLIFVGAVIAGVMTTSHHATSMHETATWVQQEPLQGIVHFGLLYCNASCYKN